MVQILIKLRRLMMSVTNLIKKLEKEREKKKLKELFSARWKIAVKLMEVRIH